MSDPSAIGTIKDQEKWLHDVWSNPERDLDTRKIAGILYMLLGRVDMIDTLTIHHEKQLAEKGIIPACRRE